MRNTSLTNLHVRKILPRLLNGPDVRCAVFFSNSLRYSYEKRYRMFQTATTIQKSTHPARPAYRPRLADLARSGSTPSSAQYSANPTSGKRSRAVQPPQRARRPIPLSVRRNGCRPSLRQRVLLCTFDNVSYAFTLLSVFFQSSSFLLYLFIDKSQSFYGCI